MSAIQQRLKAIQLRQADANIVGHGSCGGAIVGHPRGGAIVGGTHHTKKFYATHPYHMGGAIVGGRAPNAWDQYVHQNYDREYMHDYMPSRNAKQNRAAVMHDLSQMYVGGRAPNKWDRYVHQNYDREYMHDYMPGRSAKANRGATMHDLSHMYHGGASEEEALSNLLHSVSMGAPRMRRPRQLSAYQLFVKSERPIILQQYRANPGNFPNLRAAESSGNKRHFNNELLRVIAQYWDTHKAQGMQGGRRHRMM